MALYRTRYNLLELEWSKYAIQWNKKCLIQLMYNPKYIVNGQMWQYRGPKGPAIHTFFTADGTAIGMFQGSRGVRPDLDFKVKILLPNPESVPYLLPHDEWGVDLLIKAQHYKGEIIGLLNFYLHFYENCHPFNSVEERAAYAPTTIRHIEELYSNVKVDGTMSIGGIALILELFCLCEKQNPDAHQFCLTLLWTKVMH